MERLDGEKLQNIFFFVVRIGKSLPLELFSLKTKAECKQLTLMTNDFWFEHKHIHWQGPLEKPFQGNPKELNAGTLEKELNGKDLNYDLLEATSVGTMLL